MIGSHCFVDPERDERQATLLLQELVLSTDLLAISANSKARQQALVKQQAVGRPQYCCQNCIRQRGVAENSHGSCATRVRTDVTVTYAFLAHCSAHTAMRSGFFQ